MSPPKTRIQGQCSSCFKHEPEVRFLLHRRKGHPVEQQVYCVICARKRTAFNYRANKDTINAKSKARRDAHKKELIQQLGGHCADCNLAPGVEWPPSCFDFHHTDGKDHTFSQYLGRDSKRAQLFEELSHCVLLCANCHRRRHEREVPVHVRLGRPLKYPETLEIPPRCVFRPVLRHAHINRLVADTICAILDQPRILKVAAIEEVRAVTKGVSVTTYEAQRASRVLDPKFKNHALFPKLYGMTFAKLRGPLPVKPRETPSRPATVRPATVNDRVIAFLSVNPQSSADQVVVGVGHSNPATVRQLLSRLKATGGAERVSALWSLSV